MNAKRRLGRRALVRIISFTVALVAALTATSITSYALARDYRTSVEYSFQRALNELSEYLSDLSTTLDKGQYATTPKQLEGLSSKLCTDADNAKSALARLPVTGEQITSTSKFLSQVGNFCSSLSGRVAAGGSITEEELKTLDRLSDYAETVSRQIDGMISDLESGRLRLGEVKSTVKKQKDVDSPNVESGFKEIEDGFTDYPTMIYDGPFSDHILQQKPKYIKDMKDVSVDRALQAAKEASKVDGLKHTGDTAGRVPTYDFTSGSMTVSVTKAGAIVDHFLDSRNVGEPTISTDEAVKLAQKALTDRGLTGFKYRYYAVNNGVLTVNFAATQNGVILYPDLIKVGVALDNGRVVSYDAKGYIMNHTDRNLPAVKITEQQARDILSERLRVESHELALIPSEGLSEILCHEFFCRGQNDEHVLVYINAQTGMEEQILIVIENETGVLAK